jgi:hypothetical protein
MYTAQFRRPPIGIEWRLMGSVGDIGKIRRR